MKYTRKEAKARIEELDDQIVKLMGQMESIRANTQDNTPETDNQDLEELINLFEEASPNVQARLYNYIIDNYRWNFNFGLFSR